MNLPETILVIDDEEIIRVRMKGLLILDDHQAFAAGSGAHHSILWYCFQLPYLLAAFLCRKQLAFPLF